MTLRIRAGVPADCEAIARLHAESWRESYRGMMPDAYLDGPVFEDRLAHWRDILDQARADATLLIAEMQGAFTGFFYSCPDADADWEKLDNLHVVGARRSGGIGARLFRDGAARLVSAGRKQVVLYVFQGNSRACCFYKRHGGVPGAIVHQHIAGLGPFALIPYRWHDISVRAGAG